MVKRIRAVLQQLQIEADDILVPHEEQIILLQTTFRENYMANQNTEKLSQLEYQIDFLRRTNDWEDITVLTTNENTGPKL